MTNLEQIALRQQKEQMPLILSLVEVVRKHGASVREFDYASSVTKKLIEDQLLTKPVSEICDDVEAALKNI